MANIDKIIEREIPIPLKNDMMIICMAHEMEADFNRDMKEFGLSQTQLAILDIVDNHHTQELRPNKMTINEIKAQMYDSSPNVSRSLSALVEKGYATKETDRIDKRITWVSVTEEGHKVHLACDELILNAKKKSNLTSEENEMLYALLCKRSNIEK